MLDIKEYLKQTKTVLLTQDAFDELMQRAYAQPEQTNSWCINSWCNNCKEIVRCKECRHRDPEDHKCDCGHDIIWQLPRDDKWYCADAERRTDENS